MRKRLSVVIVTAAFIAASEAPLTAQGPPGGGRGGGAPAASGAGGRGGGGGGSGPNDKQIVDPVASARGKAFYIAECINCHGPKARGNDNGADLVRSLTVLHDRFGNVIGPFLTKGHPMQSGKASATLASDQLVDLSHFLHEKVNDTLRSGPYSQVINVLTGDPKAGQAYFNGAGKCNTCHSPTGDFAGIASRYDPTTIQQRFLFPFPGGRGGGGRGGGPATPAGKPVTVTITPSSGAVITGVLDRMNDFDITLKEADGTLRTIKRVAGMKVEKNNPYAAHAAMLKTYTDKDIHDTVTYLETLK